jgi:hypothetical protein
MKSKTSPDTETLPQTPKFDDVLKKMLETPPDPKVKPNATEKKKPAEAG